MSLVIDKACGETETQRQRSGLIMSPDNDNDNLYDFNLHCNWTIQANIGKRIKYFFEYILLSTFNVDDNVNCEGGDFVAVSSSDLGPHEVMNHHENMSV